MVMAAAVSASPSVSSRISSCPSTSDLGFSRSDHALSGTSLKGGVVVAVPGRRTQRQEPIRAYTTGVGQPLTVREGAAGNLTLYDLLGIPNHVTLKEIKTAYRKKARQYHPDVNPPSEGDECVRKFQEVQKAYGVLVNPGLRARYDNTLRYGLPSQALRYGISSGGIDRIASEPLWGSQLVMTPNGVRDNSAVRMPSYAPESGGMRFHCSYEMC